MTSSNHLVPNTDVNLHFRGQRLLLTGHLLQTQILPRGGIYIPTTGAWVSDGSDFQSYWVKCGIAGLQKCRVKRDYKGYIHKKTEFPHALEDMSSS